MALQSTGDADRVWSSARKVAQHIDAEIIDVSVPSIKYALPAYYIIALSEASSISLDTMVFAMGFGRRPRETSRICTNERELKVSGQKSGAG